MKIILSLYLLLVGFCGFGQKTNIELPRPKIYTQNLSSLYFQNGDKIQTIYQSNSNYVELWSKYYNQSAVLITSKNQYLYNFKAINDDRNICYKGSRVLEIKDLVNTKGEFVQFQNLEKKENLSFYPSEILINNSDCESLNKIEIEYNSNAFLALKGSLKSNSENQKFLPVVGYSYGATNQLNFTFEAYSVGLPIRCIEDIDYKTLFKENNYTYSQLLPNEFKNLTQYISSSLKSHKILQPNQNYIYNGNLIFNSDGKNVSLMCFDAKKEFQSIEKKLNEIIRNWNVYPFYDEIKVQCSSPVKIKLTRSKDEISEYTYINSKLRDAKFENLVQGSELINKIIRCSDLGFKYNVKKINYRIEINDYLQREPNLLFLNKIKGKGPVYSLLSIVPGLGQWSIRNYSTRKLKMWHLSVPVGAIAIASKIYSNLYYSRFLSDLDNANARSYYLNANVSQKVFVSSLIAYSAMSLVDFSITFAIGYKNKALQYSLNKQIKSSLSQ